jgi:dynein assembly factor 5
VIKSHGEVIPGYMPEISLILSRTLADPFVTARLVANEILRHMIATYPYNFHQYAEFMLPALFTSSNHQQSKVRASTVTSTWQLLKIAAPEHLRKNMSILVQRTFDENAIVRTALMIEVVDYLKTYRDRYSFFNLLIPILFGMFDDEDPVIAEKSKREWNEIGAVFEKENETDLKEEMDYPVAPPQAWPDSVPRSRLGCRELCGRNLMGMMNGLANDAKDNLSLENRIMATRIYGLVISHCERNIHQHVPKIIEVLNRACSDTDPQVRKNGDEIANWLTILATPELVLKVVLPGVQGFSAGTLSVLENFAKNVWNEIDLQNKLVKALYKGMSVKR